MSEKKWLASDGVTELHPFDKVLVRDDYAERWKCNFLSYKIDDRFCPFRCIDRSYSQCFPYKGNEDYVGTDSSIRERMPVEMPLEWGDRVLVWRDGGEKKEAIYICADIHSENHVILKGDRKLTCWPNCERA